MMKSIYWGIGPKLHDKLYDQSYQQKQISHQLHKQFYDRLTWQIILMQLDREIQDRRNHRSIFRWSPDLRSFWRKIVDRLKWKR